MAESRHRRWMRRWGAAVGFLLLVGKPLEGQDPPAPVARVDWALVDVVLVPDTCYGIWLLAAPNVRTSNWDRGSQIVQIAVDPLTLLQWAGTAQALAGEPGPGAPHDSVLFRVTPRLQSRSGGRFMVLARNMKRVPADQRLQFIVVDSARHIQWKTFATTDEVNRLLTTIEDVVARAPASRPLTDSSLVVDDQATEFVPVVQLKVPRPRYPPELSARHQAGRVWAEYVVGTDGRVEEGSVRVLLADHESFANAAITALERATFRPAARRGTPVRQRVFQALSFRVGF